MIINKTTIEAVFITLKTTFNKAFEAAPAVWQEIAMEVPSNTSQEAYPWFDMFPKMRRWVGEKASKALKAFKYTIVNEDFEATIAVRRNDMEDDNLGIYGPMAQGAGHSAKQWPDELVFEAVDGVFENECYDGQYFCDTDHPVEDGEGNESSVSNKGSAVLSAASQAAALASFGAGKTAMMKFKDNEGRPLGVKPNVLLVPPDLEDTANALMNNDRLEDGKVNPYKGSCKVVLGLWMTSATQWMLLDTTKPVRPFIFQKRKAPVFVSQTNMEADDVFNRGEYKFGAESRGASGYGFWQLAYGSTGDGS